MACEKDIIDIATALIVPIIGIGVWYVAYQQWKTNNLRLKNELFEKRYEIYQRATSYLHSIIRSEIGLKADSGLKADIDFIIDTSKAKFLFDDSIAKYLGEIMMKNQELRIARKDKTGTDKEEQTLNWLDAQMNEIDSIFKEYLQLK